VLFQVYIQYQGIPQQPGNGQIARLAAFFPGYFVLKIENVKVKVKYSFVLHTGLAGSHLVWTEVRCLFQVPVMVSGQGQFCILVNYHLKLSRFSSNATDV